MEFPLFYGSYNFNASNIKITSEILNNYDDSLYISRRRLIEANTRFQVDKAGNNEDWRNFEICSYIVTFSPTSSVPFEAVATYSGKGLKGEQVRDILKELGRTWDSGDRE